MPLQQTSIGTLYAKKGIEKAILKGYPWIFTNDVTASSILALCQAGDLVHIADFKGNILGTGYCNPHSQIVVRMLALQPLHQISADFFIHKLQLALKKRQAYLDIPYYRLIHSEADFLPGLIIDRFNDIFVCQLSTAGMQSFQPLILEALEVIFSPATIIFRNDMPSREKEGMSREITLAKGTMPGIIPVYEYGVEFLADLSEGQKTGWYYDQRENRRYMAALARGKSVLDVFCYTGSFGIAAGVAGASSVTFMDSSQPALELARQAVARNHITAPCHFRQGKAFDVLAELQQEQSLYDMVLLDPPPFIREKKYKMSGQKGYQKLCTLAAPLVAPNGILSLASCSHHMSRKDLVREMQQGLEKAGRKGMLIHAADAAADHPVHPLLPQSAYLHLIVMTLV